MPHILQNKNLEIVIDLPEEGYNFSRFDWSGKITQVQFKNMPLTITERTDFVNDAAFGKGFYNEFGIDTAIGFEETAIGDWFHKIGIGLLQKETEEYIFHKKHKIKPAQFETSTAPNKVVINCISESVNGYAYKLKKEIKLLKSGFEIRYNLENKGEKDIQTSEYVHNFMAINEQLMGSDYVLRFPFQLKPEQFRETVNKEKKVVLGTNEFGFSGTPNEQFFFSYISGDNFVDASWELTNRSTNIGISETASFKTQKINLWGWEHVISPELFYPIFIQAGETTKWSRTYRVKHL